MRKTLTTLAAVAALAIAAVATPAPAEARGRGGAVAAGVIGGLAAGAIIGGATRSYGYGGYGAYDGGYAGGPYYAAGGDCRIRRERFWDGYGWRVRRVEVCY
jgi:opacity protein-like surface antigen